MGRPTISGEVKENTLRIRLTDDERKVLDAAAAANGKPTGTWVRELALAAAASQAEKLAARKKSKR